MHDRKRYCPENTWSHEHDERQPQSVSQQTAPFSCAQKAWHAPDERYRSTRGALNPARALLFYQSTSVFAVSGSSVRILIRRTEECGKIW